MAITLLGDQELFRHIQEALCQVKSKRLTLTKGVYQDLEYFCWQAQELE